MSIPKWKIISKKTLRDDFAMAARGRSNQLTVFIDSAGKTYALPTHLLPSARGQGEPLSGRLKPADGARFVGVMAGDPDQLFLLASDSGYGFTIRLGDMVTRNKAGKSTLSVPRGAGVLRGRKSPKPTITNTITSP